LSVAGTLGAMADLFLLGAIVVRTAVQIWTGQAAEDSLTGVLDLVQRRLQAKDRRSVEALIDSLEVKVTDRIAAAMEVEFRDLASYEKDAAILALQRGLRSVTMTDLIAVDLSADRLRASVVAADPQATRDLSEAATRLYQRALSECCAVIIGLANHAPGFEVGVLGEMLARMGTAQHSLDDMLDLLNQLLQRIPVVTTPVTNDFEATYRGVVGRQLDRLEVLGLSGLGARAYSLSTAYVALDIDAREVHDRLRESRFSDEEEPAGARPLAVEEALSVSSRLLLRGEAGCGKTTVLQWIAVRCARGDLPASMAEWNGLVPFYIKLRSFAGRRLPRPGEFLEDVGRNVAEVMPDGWVASVLAESRAVVLVDGVDELPGPERDAVRTWLGDLIDTFPDCRYVVSSRPSGAKDDWLDRFAFDVARIEPMRMDAVRAFVSYWYTAYSETITDPHDAQRARQGADEVSNAIAVNRALQQLAGTPLLAALLCVMYLSERSLPSDRMRLYDKAIDVIMAQRGSSAGAEPANVMSTTNALVLLQMLAYWLVSNGKSYVRRSDLLRQLGPRLRALQVTVAPEPALAFLLDRSGLLREPAVGRVDFIHRTFQEFLAAAAAIDNDDIDELILRADNDQWHQVVIMAVGRAKRSDRERLIRGLLDRAAKEPAQRPTLHALAIACLETARDLDDSVRARVQKVAAALLPPRTMSDANMLAAVGELALDLVRDQPITEPRTAAATIHMAARIGGDAAFREMARCALIKNADVHNELLDAWARSEAPERFATEILARTAIRDVTMDDPALTPGLRHLQLNKLTVRFVRGFGSLAFVRHLPYLQWLEIEKDPALIDLAGLAGHARLRRLSLIDTGRVDLAPLAGLSLTDVQLKTRLVHDVAQVATLGNLTALRLTGDLGDVTLATMIAGTARLRELSLTDARYLNGLGLLTIPQLSQLKALTVRDAPNLRRLDGIEAFANDLTDLRLQNVRLANPDQIGALTRLRTLNLRGTAVRSLSFIESLPQLRTLHIGGLGQLPDLGPMRDHPTLTTVHLAGTGTVDLRPLAGRKSTTFLVYGSHRRRTLGREGLGAASHLLLR
jgi:hypothetical protein